jgi:hypothetical protein
VSPVGEMTSPPHCSFMCCLNRVAIQTRAHSIAALKTNLLASRNIQNLPPQILRKIRRKPKPTIFAFPTNTKLTILAIRNRQRLHQMQHRLHMYRFALMSFLTPHLQTVNRSVRPRRQHHSSRQAISETKRLTLPFCNMFNEVGVVLFVRRVADFADGLADVCGSF